MVVTMAIWSIVEHVELGCKERRLAGFADKTLLMIAPSKSAICSFDRLAIYVRFAPFAFAFAHWCMESWWRTTT